jgi:hypothetical protein
MNDAAPRGIDAIQPDAPPRNPSRLDRGYDER